MNPYGVFMHSKNKFYILNEYLNSKTTDYLYYSNLFKLDNGINFDIQTDSQLPFEYSIFHTSTPNVKLYYPEPFIATPTAVHDDIWFLHIVIYQYWLWFIFIFIIVFFFIVFLITLRWCNIRHRPVRETRGVSRSKCGDLITATVPVSWATSIIIHESTDAIEFNDGFGSTEMALGIRAYQWGWEYYYPKDLDLMLNDTHAKLLGNSLKKDFTLGSDQAQNLFKQNYKYANSTTPTLNSNFINLNSLKSNSNKDLLSNLNLGSNKLVPKTATNLITKTKMLNLEKQLMDNNNLNYINTIKNYSISTYFSTKPNFVNHQINFFNSKSLYLNTLNYCKGSDKCLNNMSVNTNLNVAITNTLFGNIHNKFPLDNKLNLILLSFFNMSNYALFNFNLTADQDFKRWSAGELMEDLLWSYYSSNLSNLTTIYLDYDADETSLIKNKNHNDLYANDSFSSYTLLNNFSYQLPTTNVSMPIKVDSVNYSNFNHIPLIDWLTTSLKNAFFSEKKNQLILSNLNLNRVANFTNLWSVSLKDIYQNYALNVINFDNLFFKNQNSNLNIMISEPDIVVGVKNLNTYATAIWKIFKSTIEEERGYFNFINYSNTDTAVPVIQENLTTNLEAIQKNSKSSFANFVIQQELLNLNPNSFLNLTNIFTLNFPFSLSFESDIIRYSWFDWYSVRNTLVAKAIDTSVFNLHGQKDYNYSFTNNRDLDLINKADNFFMKYQAARKLYTPVSIYTPLFYSKYLQFILNDNLFPVNSFFLWIQSLTGSAPALNNNSLDWTATTSVSRNYKPSLNFTNNETDLVIQLNDVLVRKNFIINSLNTNTLNTSTYQNLEKPLLYTLRNLKNTNNMSFSNLSKYIKKNNSDFTLKSQYQPLKKGITNMIRIQADKAIAMPTDTRIQILAVSKDIIHSWAIPSAGIKIDCIPGYSSHRVAIFTLSGIYWGQCMEICGRFHHWMPIVVYFMRRDLFCVWCIHFIFRNKQTNGTLHSYELSYRDSFFATNFNKNWNYLL